MEKETKKAVFTLMVLSPILAEVLTNSTPITELINPVSIILLFFAYSLPILILRELSVKWKTGLLGLFFMGFAYGILNEAILAKTILMQINVPVPTFDNFGFYYGINFTWAFVISSWHALHSFIFPLLITIFLYPEINNKPLLKNKTIIILSIFVFLFSLFFYIFIGEKTNFIYFIIFSILIIFLLIISKFLSKEIKTDKTQFNINSLFAGFGIAALIILSYILPTILNPILYFFYLAISFGITGFLIEKNLLYPKIILLAIGSYSIRIFALFSLINMIGVYFLPGIITSIIFLIIFTLSIIKIKIIYNKH